MQAPEEYKGRPTSRQTPLTRWCQNFGTGAKNDLISFLPYRMQLAQAYIGDLTNATHLGQTAIVDPTQTSGDPF
eukprot:1867768-Karenia_brevis.AAC.1